MKILYHIPFPVVGGAETQIQYLIQNLSADIEVFITYEYPEVETFVKKLGVASKRVYSPNNLVAAIQTYQPDIIQFYHSHTMVQAIRKSRHKAKVIEVVHNRAEFGGDATSYTKQYTHKVVCVSPDAEGYFLSKCPSVDTIVIPNGVDTHTFKPGPKRPKRKRLLGGFSGRLEPGPGKGIPELIELVKDLPIDFELVGKDFGDYTKQCEAYPNIKVLPHHHDIVEKYHEWDFFVSRSPAEGFGLSIAEAMACGLPSVIYDCGGVCSFIEDGKHALLAKNDDEMRAGIKKICEGAKLQPLKLDLSAKRMAAGYQALYHQLHTGLEVQAPSDIPQVQELSRPVERLAIAERSWYGVRRALEGITDGYADPSRDAIPKMRALKPKVIVLGCYLPQWANILEEAKRLGIKVVCTWHASFILNEFDHINRTWMWAMLDAYRKGLIHEIATPHEGLAKTFRAFGVQATFLPNIVKPKKVMKKLPGLNIGIFGSGQAWKNMECQIIAAALIPEAKIHIQNLPHPEIVNGLGLMSRVVKHPHIKSDEDYDKLVGGMTVNMVVSLSEVYSYFAAESLMMGTPVLTGSITPILKSAPGLLQLCRTPYFEDPIEIASSLRMILDPENYSDIQKQGRDYMLNLNAELERGVKDVVGGWTR